jgi:hypothetical protein
MAGRCGRAFSFFRQNRNCGQEAGSAAGKRAGKMARMASALVAGVRRCGGSRCKGFKRVMAVLAVALLWPGGDARAAVVESPRVTLIVFSDERMPDTQWTALAGELERNVTRTAVETHLVPSAIDIVRGSGVAPGFRVEEPVSVYLHGDCRLIPHTSRQVVQGPLGWVLRDRGQIGPFIHVDCARIVDMVGQYALGMNRERRDAAMAEAIARVVMHELIHVATQSAAHTSDGVEKSVYSVADLIPEYLPHGMNVGHGK